MMFTACESLMSQSSGSRYVAWNTLLIYYTNYLHLKILSTQDLNEQKELSLHQSPLTRLKKFKNCQKWTGIGPIPVLFASNPTGYYIFSQIELSSITWFFSLGCYSYWGHHSASPSHPRTS
jgi:hypothetical protein